MEREIWGGDEGGLGRFEDAAEQDQARGSVNGAVHVLRFPEEKRDSEFSRIDKSFIPPSLKCIISGKNNKIVIHTMFYNKVNNTKEKGTF